MIHLGFCRNCLDQRSRATAASAAVFVAEMMKYAAVNDSHLYCASPQRAASLPTAGVLAVLSCLCYLGPHVTGTSLRSLVAGGLAYSSLASSPTARLAISNTDSASTSSPPPLWLSRRLESVPATVCVARCVAAYDRGGGSSPRARQPRSSAGSRSRSRGRFRLLARTHPRPSCPRLFRSRAAGRRKSDGTRFRSA